LKVSELALGPFSSTLQDQGNKDAFVKIVDRYVDVGGNFIDLSDFYLGAEALFGEHLKAGRWNRESLVLASKTGLYTNRNDPNGLGLSRKHVYSALDTTLKNFGTDYIDVYYAHIWDKGTSAEELVRTWDQLLRSGKVRYVAASNFNAWQIQKIIDYAKFMGSEKIVALQQNYNLIDRWGEIEQFPAAQNEDVAIVAWGPLSAGWLSGKYSRSNKAEDLTGRIASEVAFGMTGNSFQAKGNERTWAILDTLKEVATEVKKTQSQVAINWLTKNSIPIVGPRTFEQFEDALGSVGWDLSDEQRKKLDDVSAPAPTPLGVFTNEMNPRRERI
jgi:aryl-alcohol dehydrogenase-like predicted oxidoreductase